MSINPCFRARNSGLKSKPYWRRTFYLLSMSIITISRCPSRTAAGKGQSTHQASDLSFAFCQATRKYFLKLHRSSYIERRLFFMNTVVDIYYEIIFGKLFYRAIIEACGSMEYYTESTDIVIIEIQYIILPLNEEISSSLPVSQA